MRKLDYYTSSIGIKIYEDSCSLNISCQYENTIIFALSVIGASYERGYPAGFDRPGFTRDSTMIQYNSENPGAETSWNYIGQAWTRALNTPSRYWKKESYEGGFLRC